jgi:hypothetical protein
VNAMQLKGELRVASGLRSSMERVHHKYVSILFLIMLIMQFQII